MGFTDFFASAAHNIMNRYAEMVQNSSVGRTPRHYRTPETKSEQPVEQNDKNVATDAKDKYLPSVNRPKTYVVNRPDETEKIADKPDVKEKNNSEEQPANVTPEGNYQFQRKARLDYRMNLRFDLTALNSIVEKISEGDTTSIEEFAAANFGLKAGFTFGAYEQVNTNGAENTDEAGMSKYKQRVTSEQVSKFAYQSRNFAVQSFRREALDIRRSTMAINEDGHSQAVNKFSIRYQLDNKFSFVNMSRFNVQTSQMAEQAPDAVNAYVESAGNVAEGGTNEMMGAFFDAVDGYLAQSEDTLIANAEKFFNMAAEELGFSGAMVDQARDMLVGTIESFFNRVNTAVDTMESHFGVNQPTDIEEPVTPVVDPALADLQNEVAVA